MRLDHRLGGPGASTSSTTLLQLRADSYNTLVPAQAAGTTTSTIAALPGQRTGEQSYTVQSGDGLVLSLQPMWCPDRSLRLVKPCSRSSIRNA